MLPLAHVALKAGVFSNLERRDASRLSGSLARLPILPSGLISGEKQIGRVGRVPIEVWPTAFRQSLCPAVSDQQRTARFIIVIFHDCIEIIEIHP